VQGAQGEQGVDSALTTKGDLWVLDASLENNRLGVGVDGQVLTASSVNLVGLAWTEAVPYQKFSAIATNYTVQQSDHGNWIACSGGNVVVTLPSNLIGGTQLIVDRQGTQTVTFVTSGGASLVSKSSEIKAQYGGVHAMYNSAGNYWRLVGDL
jgi:hypothetical protein